MREFGDVIDIAPDAEGWIAALERLLRGESEARRQRRKALARAGDWNSRTDTLERWLLEMIR